MSERVVNTFSGGMVSDYDAQRTGSDSYLYALNGRVIFNKDGTVSWENVPGNKVAVQMRFDYGANLTYRAIGAAEVNGKLIIFSTRNTVATGTGDYSEIGIVTEDYHSVYSYRTIFNDQYDPNGDLLRFSTRYGIEAHGVMENEDIERIVWNDDFNEPRTFNVLAGLSFNYLTPYPSWYSVHGMAQMCDVQWGLVKYRRNIKGGLTVGKRQYVYRLKHKSGYVTPWSLPTKHVFVTSDEVNVANWNLYEMEASGKPTVKGHEIEVRYIDQRFEQIEVAAILWETEEGPKEASLFYRGDITGSDMVIAHIDNSGEPVLLEEITQRFYAIERAKTQTVNDNYYHQANIKLLKNLEIDTDGITVTPKLRKMLSDQTASPNKAPLTHQVPKLSSVTKTLFNGWNEQYLIGDVGGGTAVDYINYKGTQWEHLFTGYWRDSVNPLAIVIFDKKGQPFFAQHIGDFKTPGQYTNAWELRKLSGTAAGTTGGVDDYTLTDWNPGSTDFVTDDIQQGNDFVIRILGLNISGVDLTDILYDANGKLQISGFSIVRSDRLKDIIAQGLMLPAMIFNNFPAGLDDGELVNKITPLHSCANWYPFTAGEYKNTDQDHGGCWIDWGGGTQTDVLRSIFPQIYTFEAPDAFINPNLIDESQAYSVTVVGANQMAALYAPGGSNHPIALDGDHGHYYTKQYHTYKGVTWWNASAQLGAVGQETFVHYGVTFPAFEIRSRIFRDANKSIGYGLVKILNKGLLNDYLFPLTSNSGENVFIAQGHQDTIFMTNGWAVLTAKYPGWVDVVGNVVDNKICYFNCNYRSGLPDYTITENLLANRTYFNVGHFVPINAATIAAATQVSGRVVFNDIEVWGGDCYADFFSYCRLLPLYSVECSDSVLTLDYSFGLMFPLESAYNHTMRKGVQYAHNVSRPEAAECNKSSMLAHARFEEGVFVDDTDDTYRRLEDFNVASVLQAEDKINLFRSKGICFEENNDFPLMEVHSELKILGECYDNFRRFKVNNFQYADSKYGYITKLDSLGGNIYVLQRNALGRIRFNERTLVNADAGDIAVGTGRGYDKHDYIEVEHGSQHRESVVNSGRSLYWISAEKGKMCRFGQDGFSIPSDLYGQHDFFTYKTREYWQVIDNVVIISDGNENVYDNATDVGGIRGVFDFKNKSVFYTFTKRTATYNGAHGPIVVEEGVADTIEYSEASNQYKMHLSHTPKIYFNFKQNFLSTNPDDESKLYVHNEGRRGEFYDVFYPSLLRFAVNPAFPYSKVFDTGRLNVNSGYPIVKQVTGTAEGMAAQTIILNDNVVDSRPKYREGYLVYPIMEKDQTVRLRGKYLLLEYFIDNGSLGNDDVVRITDHETIFRISQRT